MLKYRHTDSMTFNGWRRTIKSMYKRTDSFSGAGIDPTPLITLGWERSTGHLSKINQSIALIGMAINYETKWLHLTKIM